MPAAIQLIEAHSATHLPAVRSMFQAYAASLAIDLCFQGFAQELADLPGAYAPPQGGLWLAQVRGVTAGCCALRPIPHVDYPNAAEMKRLYVQPQQRGLGLGRLLAERALEYARLMGYGSVLLDTLSEMETARAMYEDLGFIEIPPYYHNPIAGAHYLMVSL